MLNGSKFVASVVCCLCLVVGALSTSNAATSGSHYPFGGEGVLAASVPPPGFYYRIYNTFYNPTKLKDNDGDELPVGFNMDLFASVHRFVHVTEKKFLGADVLWDVIVPLVGKDIKIDAAGISDNRSISVGDICIEPIGLAWHKQHWDAGLALGVIMPTGEYDYKKIASPGLGYWSAMLTAGATYYFDEEKTWSFSALTRTLVHTEQIDTEVTPGSEFVIEYGFGKQIAVNDKLLVTPGISGAAYWQLQDDSEDGPGTVADERKEAYALGGEVNFFWLPQSFQVNVRWLREFEAKNTSEGSQFVITFTKGW